MKALVWHGKHDIRCDQVPDPEIEHPRDAIVKVTTCAICGSDLHLYNHFIPGMKPGDIVGHEFMGEVVEVGAAVRTLKAGDRVIVPFPIACGNCWFCQRRLWALCDNTNPNAWMVEALTGYATAGIFGYSHLYGGYAGGQAEYVRVPFADVGPLKVENDLPDERVLFLTDVFPTGYMGAEFCDIKKGDVIAVFGAGPVGLFAGASALLLGASRVIVIDRFDYRLKKAEEAGCEVLNYEEAGDVPEALKIMTGGRGPDAVIDAVGMEAHHHHGPIHAYDRVRQAARMTTERPHALREAIMSVRNGGIVSVVGVYGGLMDKFPIGAVINRGLQIKAGQCHVHRYLKPLLARIEKGEIDPSWIISHTLPLDEAPKGYELFKHKQDACTKVVLKP